MLAKRKPVLVVAIDQLGMGRHFGQDTEPAERIVAFERLHRVLGNRRVADAVRPVAAGDDIAIDPEHRAVLAVRHVRPLARDIVQAHIFGFEHEFKIALLRRIEHVLHHFGLPVDGDEGSGQRLEVDVAGFAVEQDRRARVRKPFAAQPSIQPEPPHRLDRDAVEHARAHAALDIVAAAPFEDHGFDAGTAQQMGQEHPGRPPAYDRNLGSQMPLPQRSRISLNCHGRPGPVPTLLKGRSAGYIRLK